MWTPAEGSIRQRFPVRIYSQKQIFELAKNPQALLQIIDDAPIVNQQEWKREWDKLLSQYSILCAQQRKLKAELKEESLIKGQLSDVLLKLNVFESTQYAAILKNYQHRLEQNKAIDAWENSWRNLSEEIRNFSKNLLPQEFNLQHFNTSDEEDKAVIDAVSTIQGLFTAFQEKINAVAQQLDEIKQKWFHKKMDLAIYQKMTEAKQAYETLPKRLYEAGIDNTTKYEELVNLGHNLKNRLSECVNKKNEFEKCNQDIKISIEKIFTHRIKLTQLRRDFLKDTLCNNSYIKINIIPFGDTYTLTDDFRELINRNDGAFVRDIGEVNGDEGLLAILVQNSSENIEQRIEKMKSKLLAIYDGNEEEIATVKDRRFVSHIQSLPPESMDRIRVWFPQDSLEITYSPKSGEAFKSISQASPGQKTAALLAFIFSYGEEPLLLDQPEDDLDNKLIYDLIVNELRANKQKRQILAVTHNANIVVNGDAENIAVLDVHSGQTQIIKHGGLQDLEIRNEICRIMEGGKEAFMQRYKRINIK